MANAKNFGNKDVEAEKEPVRLQDLVQLLSGTSLKTPSGTKGFDHIVTLMESLDLTDDGILLNQKVKAIEKDFDVIVQDDLGLGDCMMYINNKALDNESLAPKFPLLFSSRNFSVFSAPENQVLSNMLKILEINFIEAEQYRVFNRQRFYNSVTIMGEYYNRTRLSQNCPINILGQSLLKLLLREFEDPGLVMDSLFARALLTQIKLNGALLQSCHSIEMSELMTQVRRFLIVQPALETSVKAVLLMCLDLYMLKFAPLSEQLIEFYLPFQNYEKDTNISINNFSPIQTQSFNKTPQDTEPTPAKNIEEENQTIPEVFEPVKITSTKKWSEQVCEDSFYESENSCYNQQDNSSEQVNISSRRSFQPQSEPRPLRSNVEQTNGHLSEKRDEPKPQPLQWRANHVQETSSVQSSEFNPPNNINDRLRYNQQNYSDHCNYSHWDRNTRREERGSFRNHRNGGNYHNSNNNRFAYDKPPRFQKKVDNQQQATTWRRRTDHQNDDNSSYQLNSNEMHSRSSSRARTLPRPAKSKMDNKACNGGRYDQSPASINDGQQRNINVRYGSQSSLASDASRDNSRRHNQHYTHSRHFTRRFHQPKEHDKNANTQEQIVRDAQKTTEYMNYLSAQK